MRTIGYDLLEKREKIIIDALYKIRETSNEFPAGIIGKETKLELLAQEYHDQLTAFQNVLTEEGFEPASEVAADYDGQIAALTIMGTVAMLSKGLNRIITTSRIHSPDLTLNGINGMLTRDAKLREKMRMRLNAGTIYESSRLRGLATNPEGIIGEQQEYQSLTIIRISKAFKGLGKTTILRFLRPDSYSP